MKSFQFKITCWIAFGFFSLMFLILIAFNGYAIHEVAHSAKRRMKTISRGILRELETYDTPSSGPIPESTITMVNEKLAFIDQEGRVAYAIVSKEHAVLYRTPGFNIPIDETFLARPHGRLFLHEVKSGGDELEDALSEWHFLFRYEGDSFTIFASDRGDYELLERFLEGLAAALILALMFALPSGYLLSRKILAPLHAIDAAAEQLRAGNLDARVVTRKQDDEISRLINTLNLTFAALQRSIDQISQFSADAAHELNTPLTVLRGQLEVCLGRERTVHEYQTVLADSVEQIISLSRMLKDLLLLAGPGRERHRKAFSLTDWSLAVEDTVTSLEMVAAGGNTRVRSNIEPEVQLVGDAPLLQRLCYNLIYNAIRFSPVGGTVTVRLRRVLDTAVFEVKDQGIGIKDEDQKKIFERFYQVDESRNTGTGLGLSLVKWIAEMHDGQIEVESELGNGSLFRVTLPMGPDET
ncbi:MAG: HAMP domain-containing histidine kinase [Lentisphaerae bacterium]|jgi:signal transduction histidine kinase|nr:HAMP domain-containing histidine kinase [Lentisphaerota bacterium]MBT7054519.1 HAMP domain-containing histidine kinase [Lentisphaerota bacterium]